MSSTNTCPSCHQPLLVVPSQIGKRAHRFEDLAFRYDACGVGFSNSSEPAARRRIFRDPSDNVPSEVRDGLLGVLEASVNIRNRRPKSFRFGSSRSEDALTWTVFEGLRKSGRLDAVLPPGARTAATADSPVVLAWGCPVAGADGPHVAEALRNTSRDLGENPSSRSEPDIILAWPSLVAFIEVTVDSANNRQPDHPAFSRYLDRDRSLYRTPEAVACAGFYELTRNWTLAARLAGALDRNMQLINLGPPGTGRDADTFSALLLETEGRRFAHPAWVDVLNDAAPLAPWLRVYLREAGVPG